MNKSEENSLAIWEMKIPSKIYGPIQENGVWRIRSNQGSMYMYMYREPDTVKPA